MRHIAARAGDGRFAVVRVNLFFHLVQQPFLIILAGLAGPKTARTIPAESA